MLEKVHFVISFLFLGIICPAYVFSQTVPVGSGSYTTQFPGTDASGRNEYPSGTPQLSGVALGKPVPTNDWWSALIKENYVNNLFNYPIAMKTSNVGLEVSYLPSGPFGNNEIEPIVVGLTALNAPKTTVSDYSDWTVTMNWDDGSHTLQATSGIAMPFVYFNKKSGDIAKITVNSGTVTISGELLIVENAKNNADFVFYAPIGSTWIKNGNVYTSTLNDKNYWSMAMMPQSASNLNTVANEYKKYAYIFPENTTATWSYDENSSVVRTDFRIETDVKEGSDTTMLIGLLPHQWANLASDSPQPNKESYQSIRGEIKTMEANSFSVENTFHGILPTLPYVDNYSEGFSVPLMNEKIQMLENDGLATWTDSYNEGQVMNRLIQTARIADLMGNTASRDKMLATIKERLEDWLSYKSGEKAFLFYYNTTWSAMLGYPAGHGQDNNLNDHHFHWGYFIHAAAFLEQFQPGWANQWGEMVNLLIYDAASPDRNNAKFPFLRSFSPYAGHCWANGFATFPNGNDQESTSESMQFNSSLIHWGITAGNNELRDLGIYLYTTEQTAVEEYWFDMNERNFRPEQQYSLVSRVWGNNYDNGTFWTADIAASYGIEMYPIHGGSLYLGHDTVYVQKLWNEMKANTGIMSNQKNPNLWHDVYWEYLAFIDPAAAIEMYDSYPDRELKFGISDAQTYHWLHAMNALGKIDASITADYPIAAAFKLNEKHNYVAHNYSKAPITVTFSDGYKLQVPAGKMVTSRDCQFTGVITSLFPKAYVGGSTTLKVIDINGTPDKIEFMDGTTLLGILTSEPYTLEVTDLQLGIHGFYAKIYDGEKFSVTNSVQVQVGEQVPYKGSIWAIPGIIEAGNYDKFEGGKGQNISYLDNTTANEGDFRTDESVDASNDTAEGAVIHHINTNEWVEYTVDVAQSGNYSMAFRYASGNSQGGGPFHLELDGESITSDITVPLTSTTVWTIWATKTVTSIPFTPGEHTLRVAFSSGEFHFGKMTFTRTGDLDFSYPTANAGSDVKVVLPSTETTLNGSKSTESAGKTLTYLWTQNYGSDVVIFSDKEAQNPTISGFVKGMYSFKLTVTNTDLRTDEDEILILVTDLENAIPVVSITSPENNSTFTKGNPLTITASASDFDGTVQKVDFYSGSTLISTATNPPYSIQWNPETGIYDIIAKATDNAGAEGYSQIVKVNIDPLLKCSEMSTSAQQGSFSLGYISTFETVGTDVIITFELLDPKSGVVAYLWRQSPFSESQMTHISGKKFTATVSDRTLGTTIKYACKFVYGGGMSVTAYVSYEVGKNCDVNVGVGQFSMERPIIYPNPTYNEITISNITENADIAVYDISGKLLINRTAKNKHEIIDISSLTTGLYIVKVRGKNRTTTSKLIKR